MLKIGENNKEIQEHLPPGGAQFAGPRVPGPCGLRPFQAAQCFTLRRGTRHPVIFKTP